MICEGLIFRCFTCGPKTPVTTKIRSPDFVDPSHHSSLSWTRHPTWSSSASPWDVTFSKGRPLSSGSTVISSSPEFSITGSALLPVSWSLDGIWWIVFKFMSDSKLDASVTLNSKLKWIYYKNSLKMICLRPSNIVSYVLNAVSNRFHINFSERIA